MNWLKGPVAEMEDLADLHDSSVGCAVMNQCTSKFQRHLLADLHQSMSDLFNNIELDAEWVLIENKKEVWEDDPEYWGNALL